MFSVLLTRGALPASTNNGIRDGTAFYTFVRPCPLQPKSEMTNGLSLIVHRSAAEIGGNCIELRAGGARLLLDVGRPLSADPTEPD